MTDDAYRNRSAEKREAKFNYFDLDHKDLVFKSENDLYRVYRDGSQFELYGRNDGLITALLDSDEAKERAKVLDRYQSEGNPNTDMSKDALDK